MALTLLTVSLVIGSAVIVGLAIWLDVPVLIGVLFFWGFVWLVVYAEATGQVKQPIEPCSDCSLPAKVAETDRDIHSKTIQMLISGL